MDHQYCDECGKHLNENEVCAVAALDQSISSCNEGESATLCESCYFEIVLY